MNKLEFLFELEERLKGLPDEDRKKSLEYYFEIIDDRMDEGLSEEEAVAACGDPEQIAEQIIMDTPMAKLVKQKAKSRQRMRPWEIVLLILGFPLWICLLVAFFCILLAVSSVLWVIVGCVFIAGIVCGAVGFAMSVMAIVSVVQGQVLPALFFFGCGLICAGLTILFFLLGKVCGKGVAKLHQLTFRGVKRCFIRKEAKV